MRPIFARRQRVLQDIFHLLQRFGRACNKHHPLFGVFMSALSDAFFVNCEEDIEAVKKLLIKRGMAQADVDRIARKKLIKQGRGRRTVPGPNSLAKRLKYVCFVPV